MKIKSIIFAITLSLSFGANISSAQTPSFAPYMAFNNSAGPGGQLQDNTPQDLTDCCGGQLFAR